MDKSKPRKRRAADARMKARAKAIYSHDDMPHRHADHLCLCSGPCCGNPRRWTGEKTIQERRAGA